MRTRLDIWRDGQSEVLQSLDLPQPGSADEAPDGRNLVRVPDSAVLLEFQYLRDDAPTRTRGFFNDLAAAVHQNARNKGFWDASTDVGMKIALAHGELSEALEDYRKIDSAMLRFIRLEDDEHGQSKPEGMPVELADVIIRVLDLAAYMGFDMDEAIRLKVAFNAGRPMMHGRKV
jgi:NTP pyrophosphatase (non-canonical NTP hydrolase)